MLKKILCLIIGILFIAIDGYSQQSTSYQSACSKEMGYTVYYPTQGWYAWRDYYNAEAPEHIVAEHVILQSDNGAYISIDVWKPKIEFEEVEPWLWHLHDILKVSVPVGYQKTKVTQENIPAIYYKSEPSTQTFISHTTMFKSKNNKIFQVTYIERDLGAGKGVYDYLLSNFVMTATGKEFASEFQKTSGRETRVYSCGGVQDTCQCNANNPYPCCSNDGNCTWWAWHSACCNWGVGLPGAGNAKTWASILGGYGYPVSSTPAPGTIGCRDQGTWGHVVYVISVGSGTVYVSEMNCDYGAGGVQYKTYNTSYFTGGFIYPK